MLRRTLPAVLVAFCAVAGAHADDKLLLKSVKVDLPFGDRMFEGSGSDVANNNCLACHSAGMVLNQPALSKAQWRTEVEKMRTAYKAPIDPRTSTPSLIISPHEDREIVSSPLLSSEPWHEGLAHLSDIDASSSSAPLVRGCHFRWSAPASAARPDRWLERLRILIRRTPGQPSTNCSCCEACLEPQLPPGKAKRIDPGSRSQARRRRQQSNELPNDCHRGALCRTLTQGSARGDCAERNCRGTAPSADNCQILSRPRDANPLRPRTPERRQHYTDRELERIFPAPRQGRCTTNPAPATSRHAANAPAPAGQQSATCADGNHDEHGFEPFEKHGLEAASPASQSRRVSCWRGCWCDPLSPGREAATSSWSG
jgi:hypothetical protein